MKRIGIIILVVIAFVAASYAVYHFLINDETRMEESGNAELYICPMHPEIQSNHPGVCPICNMDLVLKESSGVDNETDVITTEIVKSGDVMLSPSQQVLANVQTEKVKVKEYRYDVTFDGYVKAPDNNMRKIATPVSGKIVKMYLNFEGQPVSKGMKVFDIYSPEIYSAQKEYLLALRNYENALKTDYEIVREQAEDLLNSTRTRLSLWEVTPEQIEELETTREVRNFITVRSIYNGIVTRKIDNEGQWISAGESVYELADLSTIWIFASVPESDLSYIRIGQTGVVSSISYPGEEFTGRVNFINPVMNSETRSLEVRLDVPNRNYKLKPDMYVSVEIKAVRYEWNIIVPRESLIRTGKEDLVYVKTGENVYSPRKVSVGGEKDDFYLLTSGINEGEEIVTSAGFLIDSESRIRTGSSSNTSHIDDKKSVGEEDLNRDQDVMKDMKEHNH